jgi:hypothetical protein
MAYPVGGKSGAADDLKWSDIVPEQNSCSSCHASSAPQVEAPEFAAFPFGNTQPSQYISDAPGWMLIQSTDKDSVEEQPVVVQESRDYSAEFRKSEQDYLDSLDKKPEVAAGAFAALVEDAAELMQLEGLGARLVDAQKRLAESERITANAQVGRAKYVRSISVMSCHAGGQHRLPGLYEVPKSISILMDKTEAVRAEVRELAAVKGTAIAKFEQLLSDAVTKQFMGDGEPSADFHSVLAIYFERTGENDVAKRHFKQASVKASNQTDRMFFNLRAFQQLSGAELASHRGELKKIYFGKIPALVEVAELWEERSQDAYDYSSAVTQLYDTLSYANNEDEVMEMVTHFTVQNKGLLERMGNLFIGEAHAKAPPRTSGAFPFMNPDMRSILSDAMVPGHIDGVMANKQLAWKLLFQAELHTEDDEKDVDRVLRLEEDLFKGFEERVEKTGGELSTQETVLMAQNMGLVLEHATRRMGYVEHEVVEGELQYAERACALYSKAMTFVNKALDHQIKSDDSGLLIGLKGSLEMRLAYDAKMAMHEYEEALMGLADISEIYRGTPLVDARMSAVRELFPHHFDSDGRVISGLDFSETDVGRDAASRERSIYFTNTDLTTDLAVTAAGGLGGAAIGCGIGGFIMGAGGTLVAPGPGTAGGASGGCKIGGIIGGVLGGIGSEVAHMAYNVKKNAAYIDAARRTGMTNISEQEYHGYLKSAGIYVGAAGLGGLLFAKPGMSLANGTIRLTSSAAKGYTAMGGIRGIAELGVGRVGNFFNSVANGLRYTVQQPRLAFATATSGTVRAVTNSARSSASTMFNMSRENPIFRLVLGEGQSLTRVSAQVAHKSLLSRFGAHFGLIEGESVAKLVGWKVGIKNVTNAVFHDLERASVPYLGLETIFRDQEEGKSKLSWAGGIALMFAVNRVAIAAGLDPSGQRLLVMFDRAADAVPQIMSGQKLKDVDMYRLAVNYGTGSVFGQWRGRLLRDALSRRAGQAMVGNVKFKMGRRASDKMKVSAMDPTQRSMLKKLLMGGSSENVTFVNKSGEVLRGVKRTKADKLGRRYVIKSSAAEAKVVATLTQAEKVAFAKMMSARTGFDGFFAKKAVRYVKVGTDLNNFKGWLAFCVLHDTVLGTVWDGFRGEYMLEGDGWNIGAWTLARSGTTLPLRNLGKLALGWDTSRAVLFDRVFGRYMLDPLVTKWFPHYPEQGFWRNGYSENMGQGMDVFLDHHTGREVFSGGLDAWGAQKILDTNNPKHFMHLKARVDEASLGVFDIRGGTYKGESPYKLIGKAYRTLANFYAGKKTKSDQVMDKAELRELDAQVSELITEAKRRLEGWDDSSIPGRSIYDNATIVEHALAFSAAVKYAHDDCPLLFTNSLEDHKDWFEMLESSGIAGEIKSPDDVMEFVDTYIGDKRWMDDYNMIK